MQSANSTLMYVEVLAWPLTIALTVLVVTLILRSKLRHLKSSDILQSRQLSPFLYSKNIKPRTHDAIQDAEAVNNVRERATPDPSVRLGKSVKFKPREYRKSIQEIAYEFHRGRVVVIDLSDLEDEVSQRLVDFCSGITYMSQGWIYRITENVLIITPQHYRNPTPERGKPSQS